MGHDIVFFIGDTTCAWIGTGGVGKRKDNHFHRQCSG